MNDIKNEYRCVTDLVEVKAYLGAAKIVSFDYEKVTARKIKPPLMQPKAISAP